MKQRSENIKNEVEAIETDPVPLPLCRDPRLNACLYVCEICHHKTFSKEGLLLHIKTQHRMDRNVYQDKFPDPMLKKRGFHSCRVCGEMVIHDYIFIQRHVQKKHKLLTRDYLENYL